MRTNRKNLQRVFPIILIIGTLALLSWGNYLFVKTNPGGNDFLVHWMGTRMFFWEGFSPYSDETALNIQEMVYGRPAQAGEHELRVAYPLYSTLLFLPFSAISDFSLSRSLWMSLLEVGLIALSLMSIRLMNWRLRFPILTCFLLFSLLWYHGARPLINGNAVILVAVCFIGALLAYQARADELAGVLIAFSTIKPQLALLISAYLVFYSIFRKRWKFIIWFFGTLLLLVLFSTLLLPDWILQNLREIFRYPGYNPPGTLQAALEVWFPSFGHRLGLGITGLLAVLLITEWWLSRKGEFRSFLWCCCFTLVVSQWIGIQTDPGNFIILMPALVLVFTALTEKLRSTGELISAGIMLFLTVSLWLLFIQTLEIGYQPQQSPIMFLPLPGLLLIGLYWIRWWVTRPQNIMYEWLSTQNTIPRR